MDFPAKSYTEVKFSDITIRNFRATHDSDVPTFGSEVEDVFEEKDEDEMCGGDGASIT
jgi:hypothetical protein